MEMSMGRLFWLFKSEPNTYSFDDLVQDVVAEWDGVRNYQARNFLRDDIQKGDGVLFYHSSSKPLAVIGTANVVRGGYPDYTAWDPISDHPDAKSTPDHPIWFMVDLEPIERFATPVTLEDIRNMPGLSRMTLLKRGVRLSIQPVTVEEWEIIRGMGEPMQINVK